MPRLSEQARSWAVVAAAVAGVLILYFVFRPHSDHRTYTFGQVKQICGDSLRHMGEFAVHLSSGDADALAAALGTYASLECRHEFEHISTTLPVGTPFSTISIPAPPPVTFSIPASP